MRPNQERGQTNMKIETCQVVQGFLEQCCDPRGASGLIIKDVLRKILEDFE